MLLFSAAPDIGIGRHGFLAPPKAHTTHGGRIQVVVTNCQFQVFGRRDQAIADIEGAPLAPHPGFHPGVTGHMVRVASVQVPADIAGRDFQVKESAQLRNVVPGDACPRCGRPLKLLRGIEVGHVFKLGTKYSEAMHAGVLDEAGKERNMVMGCYGIGVTRIVAAAIEQSHDERGIIWPQAIAPYRAIILALGKDPEILRVAEKLHAELTDAGIETLLDDRGESPGVQFNDADLLGIPKQVLVGKTYQSEKLVEVKQRGARESVKVALEHVAAKVLEES